VTRSFDSSETATSTDALRLDRPRSMPRIGEMMIARGLITAEQLDVALDHQRASGQLMGEILVDLGILDPVDLCRILAERRGYQFVDLRERSVDLSLMDLVPEEVARRYSALPIAHQDDHVVVAMAQPENVFALDDLRVLTELPVFPVMAEPQQISAAISRCYGTVEPAAEPVTDTVAGAASNGAAANGTAPEPANAEPEANEPSPAPAGDAAVTAPAPSAPSPPLPEEDEAIIRLVSVLFEQAIRERATDVHIEALSDKLRVRFRVDGLLREVSDAPLSALRPLISRVKVLAGMDVGRSRVPREGRFAVSVEERDIDVRVAILPTAHDDSCVLRLLDRERSIADVEMLGFANDQRARYTDAIRKPRGLVVVSGPAGSGRTSTLYATMRSMNTPERSLSSVEDPIAYHVDGIKQLEVDELAGLSFRAALRLVLHSDPEAVLVDEIEESESLALATDAAIAGRLLLAALHAPSAVAVPLRMVDMGVEPYLVAASLSCVVSQRLVRTLCPYCSQEDARSRPLLQKLGVSDDALEASTLRRPVGCDECRDSGYLGRTAVFEVMPITEPMQRLVQDRAPAPELKRLAVAEGMETMRSAALNRALAGETSLEEVLRAIA
jgi:type IV pilus assembly protein PilB